MDRRTFLKGTAASAGAGRLALGGLGGGTGALTLARPARAQEADVHRFTFGEFEVTVLSDGRHQPAGFRALGRHGRKAGG